MDSVRYKAAHAHATATLTANGDDPALYADAIERYAHAVDLEAVVRESWERECRNTLALGERRQLAPHPLLKAIRDAETHSDKLAKALGITPEARANQGKRAGQPMGMAHAPDRSVRRVA